MKEEREFVAVGTQRVKRKRVQKDKLKEWLRVAVQSNSMGSPLEIVLNVSLWNHWAGLSFCLVSLVSRSQSSSEKTTEGGEIEQGHLKRQKNRAETAWWRLIKCEREEAERRRGDSLDSGVEYLIEFGCKIWFDCVVVLCAAYTLYGSLTLME